MGRRGPGPMVATRQLRSCSTSLISCRRSQSFSIAAQPNAGGLARRVGAALKRFIPSADVVSTAANRKSPPRITFPPNGAHLVLARNGSSFAPLALEAMGGAPPYRWAVNGQPLAPAPNGAPTAWMPDGPGFVRISVTDHHHKSITADVWIE